MRQATQMAAIAASVVCLWGCRDRALTSAATMRAEVAQGAEPASRVVARRVLAGGKLSSVGSPSPDGRYFTFTDWWEGDGLAIHDFVTGTNQHLTTHPAETYEYAADSTFSADGRQIAYAWFNSGSFADLRIMSREGGTPRVLYANKEASVYGSLDWSSDGAQIACVLVRPDRAKQIALIKVADGSVRVLKTFGWLGPARIALSPNGRFILYEFRPREESKNHDLAVLSTDGTRDTPLVTDPSDDFVLGWIDDRTVLFASDRGGTVGAWAMDVVDGRPSGEPRHVKPDLWRMTPGRFSRTGAYYYFVEAQAGEVFTTIIDPQTGNVLAPPAPLTPSSGPSRPSGQSPDWSPDGRYLAHISGSPAFDTLTIRSFETGEIRDLPSKMSRIIVARWSPDGRSFVVQGTDQKGRAGFYRIDAQTGAVSLLLSEKDSGGLVPTLSADGRRLYYAKRHPNPTAYSIVEHNLDSGEERVILQPQPGFAQTVILSPDGRHVAFSSSNALYVISTGGGDTRELYRVPERQWIAQIGGLAWTPDGRQLVFVTMQSTGDSDRSQLWRIATDGGEPEKLDVSMEHLLGVRVHPDGRRVAFSAGQSRTELWVMENLRSVVSPQTSAQRR